MSWNWLRGLRQRPSLPLPARTHASDERSLQELGDTMLRMYVDLDQTRWPTTGGETVVIPSDFYTNQYLAVGRPRYLLCVDHVLVRSIVDYAGCVEPQVDTIDFDPTVNQLRIAGHGFFECTFVVRKLSVSLVPVEGDPWVKTVMS